MRLRWGLSSARKAMPLEQTKLMRSRLTRSFNSAWPPFWARADTLRAAARGGADNGGEGKDDLLEAEGVVEPDKHVRAMSSSCALGEFCADALVAASRRSALIK